MTWKETGRAAHHLGERRSEPAQDSRGGEHDEGAFDAGGETALRIDYAHGPVVTFTPRFWALESRPLPRSSSAIARASSPAAITAR